MSASAPACRQTRAARLLSSRPPHPPSRCLAAAPAGSLQLLSDTCVAFAVILLHGAVLMCLGIVFSVAMNSQRHALLALLIAANFVEIKGTVYKRMDTSKRGAPVCLVGAGAGFEGGDVGTGVWPELMAH